MPTETILPDQRLGEVQTHLHLHRRRITLTGRWKCAYCNEGWERGACPTKRDAEMHLDALAERRRQANAGPVVV